MYLGSLFCTFFLEFFFFFLRFHQTNCLKQCRFPFQVQRKVLEDEMRGLGVDMDDKDNVSVDGRGWGGALSWEPGQEQVTE